MRDRPCAADPSKLSIRIALTIDWPKLTLEVAKRLMNGQQKNRTRELCEKSEIKIIHCKFLSTCVEFIRSAGNPLRGNNVGCPTDQSRPSR